MPGRMKYPITVTVRLSKETKDKLDTLTEKMELPYSELLRNIVEDYVK
jgi:predicted DNA-binding protein